MINLWVRIVGYVSVTSDINRITSVSNMSDIVCQIVLILSDLCGALGEYAKGNYAAYTKWYAGM